jgi:signal transduction histidine kinase
MQNSSLLSTQRKLILIFVIGAFSFLLIFEAFFIGTRVVMENNFQTADFETQIVSILDRDVHDGRKRNGPPPIGITSIVIDGSGDIIEARGNIDESSISELMQRDELTSLPIGKTINDDGILMRRMYTTNIAWGSVIFLRKAGYTYDDILRDIMRFLVMDILLLIPFYFVGRYFVGRALEPVAANIDTMSHFIHDAGHELKTPLAIVSGNLQLLRDSKKIDPTVITESISTIQSMGNSLDGLVELANLKAPAKAPSLDLHENIDEILLMHHEQLREKHITVDIHIPKNARISIEKKHFGLLFSNLITNAIRYNNDWGTIAITLKGKKLTIADTGIGMTDEQQKRIFERFYRADRSGKIPGTGIWLTIVERIIRLYGWDISVESTPGTGTSFTITMR